MKEKNIKTIIKVMTEQYGYLLEDIKSEDNSDLLWTVIKDISGTKYRLIFITLQSLNEVKQFFIPEDKNNVYVLISGYELGKHKDEEVLAIKEALSINNLLEKPLITVDIKDKKVNYSENVNLQVVQEIAAVMSNNNLQGNSEKTSIEDKPFITIGIIAINVIMYAVTAYLSFAYASGSIFNSDTDVLILLGAKVNELIASGQYYRLISCMFLHGGLVHLGVNMYSLHAIGPMVEKVYGRAKYIIIYLFAGICASIFSYLFSTSVSIGASGAIFGTLGAVLVFAIKSKGKAGSGFIRSILSVIFINIFIGATLPNIDNFAHIGGLIGGMLIAFLVSFRTEVE